MADTYPDPAAQKRIDAELAAVDRAHREVGVRCTLCGQLTFGLDKFGLCSKTSVTHAEVRGDAPPKGRR